MKGKGHSLYRELKPKLLAMGEDLDALILKSLKHDLVYRHLKRIFASMGVPNLRFHDLRHTYAVLSLRSGCDIKTVQENLGHYAAAFTLDTYAHVTEQMRREGADKINQFVEKIGAG